jgi:hypothetical protein
LSFRLDLLSAIINPKPVADFDEEADLLMTLLTCSDINKKWSCQTDGVSE